MFGRILNISSIVDIGEIARFGAVGLFHNMIGYVIFLVLFWLGTSPYLLVAIGYPLAVFLSYILNKKITFNHNGKGLITGVKFVGIHIIGCLLNIFLLYFLGDFLSVGYEFAQLFSVFVVGGLLYLCMKFFVFV